MRQFTSCVWIALLSGVLTIPTEPDHSKWESFKALHGKNHPTHEEPIRKQPYLERTAHIDAHNELHQKDVEGFAMGRSQYSDLPPEEFVVQGLLPRRNLSYLLFPPKPFPDILPENFDWRDLNIMTPVRNQGKCGACYAFAAVAVLEAHLKRKTKHTYDLSEQEILDCTYQMFDEYNMGCAGGYVKLAFEHIVNEGVVSEDEYPYYSGNGTFHGHCPPLTRIANITKQKLTLKSLQPENENEMANLVFAYGPIVVYIAAEKEYKQYFERITDEIIDLPQLINANPNHAVVLAGFGTENGTDYWLFKNSWGEKWGMGGYGKIRRGVNMCNILSKGATFLEVK